MRSSQVLQCISPVMHHSHYKYNPRLVGGLWASWSHWFDLQIAIEKCVGYSIFLLFFIISLLLLIHVHIQEMCLVTYPQFVPQFLAKSALHDQ